MRRRAAVIALVTTSLGLLSAAPFAHRHLAPRFVGEAPPPDIGAQPVVPRASVGSPADCRRCRGRAAGAEWVRALPVGNGRLGAMVFGGVVHERLQLNEDTLWAGRPYDPVNPDAKAAIPDVRRLLGERPATPRRRSWPARR